MSEISCEEVLSQIEHYLHGELDSLRSVHLAEHLETCTPCLQRADFQRRLKKIVQAKCRSEAPEYLVRRIQHVLRTEIRIEDV